MKPVVISFVAAICLVIALCWAYWNNRSAERVDAHQPDPAIVRLKEKSDELESELAYMRKRVAELESDAASKDLPDPSAVTAARTSSESPAPDREDSATPPGGEAIDAPLTEEERKQQVLDEALAQLLDESPNWDERAKIFRTLNAEGLVDDVLAEYKKRAEENPENPDFHAELGDAYIQKLFYVNDIEKGTLSMKAHKAYDQALAVDDHHWGARFSKAVNYSFAPAVFGMQPKAIEQFEILVGQQQEAQVTDKKYSETYLLLGNLHANQGSVEKARAVWADGLKRHPESKQLREQLDGVKKP